MTHLVHFRDNCVKLLVVLKQFVQLRHRVRAEYLCERRYFAHGCALCALIFLKDRKGSEQLLRDRKWMARLGLELPRISDQSERKSA